jgi:hypothetical protein
MPPSLHEELADAAEAEGVSINQFICYVLAGAVRSGARGLEGGDQGGGAGVGELVRRNDRRAIEEAAWKGWQDMFR